MARRPLPTRNVVEEVNKQLTVSLPIKLPGIISNKDALKKISKPHIAATTTPEEEIIIIRKTLDAVDSEKKNLKDKAKKVKDTLADDISDIESVLASDNFVDNTWMKTYELMFNKLQSIMRKVENKVASTEKAADIYALMALYNQMREVIADIRSMVDLTQNTQKIIDNILYPLVRDISNNYVDAIFLIKKTLRSNVEGEKYIELKSEIDGCLKEHAKYIQSSYEKSSEQLAKLLED